jgi:hypothetical protein
MGDGRRVDQALRNVGLRSKIDMQVLKLDRPRLRGDDFCAYACSPSGASTFDGRIDRSDAMETKEIISEIRLSNSQTGRGIEQPGLACDAKPAPSCAQPVTLHCLGVRILKDRRQERSAHVDSGILKIGLGAHHQRMKLEVVSKLAAPDEVRRSDMSGTARVDIACPQIIESVWRRGCRGPCDALRAADRSGTDTYIPPAPGLIRTSPRDGRFDLKIGRAGNGAKSQQCRNSNQK